MIYDLLKLLLELSFIKLFLKRMVELLLNHIARKELNIHEKLFLNIFLKYKIIF